jgi:hypothetical protein
MHPSARVLVTMVLTAAPAATLVAQPPAMPSGMTHAAHRGQMQQDGELTKRGAVAMGFDQDTSTHHFRLDRTGGVIEVVINDPADEAGRDRIRTHLKEIAAEFAAADFGEPLLTHGEVPPGVSTMQARTRTLTFTYEDRPDGGMVRIATADAEARRAVHEFLRYQIREHATGDPLTVAK